MCSQRNRSILEPYSVTSYFKNEHIHSGQDNLLVETTCLRCDHMFISDLQNETLGEKQRAHLLTCRHGIKAMPKMKR
jgi:hypothetical protein